ncbi:taurine ABC transporter substrate-binding protein [Mangrovicoccus algicola]|uniref:ABC transporter substrate-binding protein n=1 Tax=Mangrovicoccus algicola TaxID=2771008 RepID=A0A8J6YVE2_9RHOB|nr:ABC transporter substrate-binding protein [Mangrovicoccus algicola]MBE3639948.1 ABC transporter substrate-binding protein [Mangrovicoccus algicola]
MTRSLSLLLAGTAAAALSGAAAAAQDQLTVGYFLEWPMPFLAAKADGTYDEALGMPVNWVAFETGTAMSAAMASGDVQISVSQGVPPFVVAASAGQPLVALDVAVSYSDNDNCVVATAREIDKDSASELEGATVAVPMGTAAHYGFLRQMDHFGVPLDSLEIVDMAPTDGAAALAQGAVDMACGYGGGLTRMKEHGNVLLTGQEKEDLGILVFDVTSAPQAFVAENPDLVAAFLGVTAEANAAWNAGEGKDEMLQKIAAESGMSPEATAEAIATMQFPPIEAQLSPKWMGGAAQTFMKGVADVFVAAGSIDSALDSYEAAVDTGPLAAAAD